MMAMYLMEKVPCSAQAVHGAPARALGVHQLLVSFPDHAHISCCCVSNEQFRQSFGGAHISFPLFFIYENCNIRLASLIFMFVSDNICLL